MRRRPASLDMSKSRDEKVRSPDERNLLQFSTFVGRDEVPMSPGGRFCRVMTQISGANTPRKFKAVSSNDLSHGGSASSQEEDWKDDAFQSGKDNDREEGIAVSIGDCATSEPMGASDGAERLARESKEVTTFPSRCQEARSITINERAMTGPQVEGVVQLKHCDLSPETDGETFENSEGTNFKPFPISETKRSSRERFSMQHVISRFSSDNSRRQAKDSERETASSALWEKGSSQKPARTAMSGGKLSGVLIDDTAIQPFSTKGLRTSPKSNCLRSSKSLDGQIASRTVKKAQTEVGETFSDLPTTDVGKGKNFCSKIDVFGDQDSNASASPRNSLFEFLHRRSEKIWNNGSSLRTSGELLESLVRRNSPRWKKAGREFDSLAKLKSRKSTISPLQLYSTELGPRRAGKASKEKSSTRTATQMSSDCVDTPVLCEAYIRRSLEIDRSLNRLAND